MEPSAFYEILKAARAAAEEQVEECYAAFPKDIPSAKRGIGFFDSALRRALVEYAEAERAEEITVID